MSIIKSIEEISKNKMVIDWLIMECNYARKCSVKRTIKNIEFPGDCKENCRKRIVNQYTNMFGNK